MAALRFRWLKLALLFLAPLGAQAAQLTVSAMPPNGTETRDATLTLTRQGPVSEVLEETLTVPGNRVLDVPEGAWKVVVRSPGFWSEEQVVLAGREPASLSFQLVPAGRLKATVDPPRGEAAPAVLAVRFTPVPSASAAPLPQSTLSCPVRERIVECELPAGHLDIRFRAEGLVPVYRWGVLIPAGKTADLTPVVLRRGASVAGWIQAEPGGAPSRPVRVELKPQSAGLPERAVHERLQSRTLETRSNERGFFLFEGVPPGSYGLEARDEGFAPARLSPVAVHEGLQTELLEPLVLARPVRFEIAVEPAADPYGGAWQAVLTEQRTSFDPELGRWQGAVSPDGRWSQSGLAPGEYRLTLLGRDGSRWFGQVCTVARDQPVLEIRLPLVEVRGRVTLGDEPIAATLWFGGAYGERRVRFEADAEGRFEGLLPEEGLWPVHLVSGAENLRLPLKPVEVKVSEGKSFAQVEIRVPDTRLAGEVVDERGRKVARAAVSLLNTSAEVETDSDGEFELRGLEPGLAMVEAEDGERSSGVVEATVEEARETPRLRLVLRETLEARGRVVSPHGPVPGAELMAIPAVDQVGGASIVTAISGPDGRFRLDLPGTTRSFTLLVFAPGYAMRLLPVAARGAEALEVSVEAAGGTLAIDLPAAGSPHPLLLHNGTFIPVGLLSRWVRLQGGAPQSDRRLVVHNVEPGDYGLCAGSASPEIRQGRDPGPACHRGFLSAREELVLALPR